jgi:hypothetical protein
MIDQGIIGQLLFGPVFDWSLCLFGLDHHEETPR